MRKTTKGSNNIVTAAELATYFECSAVYVSVLTKEKDMPKEKDGYNLKDATRWYIKFLRDEKKNGSNPETEAKIRQLTAKASLTELELAKEREELLTVEDAIQVISESLTSIKSTLMSLPSRIAPQVLNMSTASEIEALVKKIINEALDELSEIHGKITDASKVGKELDKEDDELPE